MSATLSHFRGTNGDPPSQATTFRFCGQAYTVTSVTVQAPQPEVVNMTSVVDTADKMVMVPTGGYTSPGEVSVEGYGFFDPRSLVGKVGQFEFLTPGGTISARALCDSVSVEAKAGDVLRVRFNLKTTDYPGT